MHVPALKTSAVFLALPVAMAVAGFPGLAFGWIVALQFPPYFLLMIVSLIFLIGGGLMQLRSGSFVTCGLLSAAMLLVMALSSTPSNWASVPLYAGQAILLAFSTFVPFATIQLVLSLFVPERELSPEELE
jgi:hypothetical protein